MEHRRVRSSRRRLFLVQGWHRHLGETSRPQRQTCHDGAHFAQRAQNFASIFAIRFLLVSRRRNRTVIFRIRRAGRAVQNVEQSARESQKVV